MRKAGVLEMRRLLQLCSVGLVVLAAAAGLSAPLARAQGFQVAPNSTSTIPLSARYEIVASPIASRWTFRLDRVCGHVALLVTTVYGGNAWQDMPVLGLPPCRADGMVHYQLFSSSIAAKWTYLMNVDSGKAWQLTGITNAKGEKVDMWEELEG